MFPAAPPLPPLDASLETFHQFIETTYKKELEEEERAEILLQRFSQQCPSAFLPFYLNHCRALIRQNCSHMLQDIPELDPLRVRLEPSSETLRSVTHCVNHWLSHRTKISYLHFVQEPWPAKEEKAKMVLQNIEAINLLSLVQFFHRLAPQSRAISEYFRISSGKPIREQAEAIRSWLLQNDSLIAQIHLSHEFLESFAQMDYSFPPEVVLFPLLVKTDWNFLLAQTVSRKATQTVYALLKLHPHQFSYSLYRQVQAEIKKDSSHYWIECTPRFKQWVDEMCRVVTARINRPKGALNSSTAAHSSLKQASPQQ